MRQSTMSSVPYAACPTMRRRGNLLKIFALLVALFWQCAGMHPDYPIICAEGMQTRPGADLLAHLQEQIYAISSSHGREFA